MKKLTTSTTLVSTCISAVFPALLISSEASAFEDRLDPTAPIEVSIDEPKTDATEERASIGSEEYVSIATGMDTPIGRAPAVASVITAQQISESGAVDLDEALALVPGLHVSHSSFIYNPIYIVRGIRSQYNSQILMLVNGIPVTSYFAGDRGSLWGGLPVDNIARIEAIRGPGSALYGADAFSGVINIITKTANDIGGTKIGARYGSFDSKDAYILHGGKIGDIQVAAYLRGGTTDGDKQNIDIDAQTSIDNTFGTNVSKAPGPLNLQKNAFDAAIDLSMDSWRFRSSLKQREKMGPGPGFAQALDPTGENLGKRFTSDLTYEAKQVTKGLNVTGQVSYWWLNEDNHLTLLPAGTMGGAFPDGILDDAYTHEKRTRGTVTATYTNFDGHRILAGVGAESSSIYGVSEYKNYTYQSIPGVGIIPVPLDPPQLVGQDMVFITTHDRNIKFAFIQDEWEIVRDWTLTAGVRKDSYSDVGSTVNPRVALVWDVAYNITNKLMYGKAFRAPAFAELYTQNNPINLGNPNLHPERIESYEYAVVWQTTPKSNVNLNLFKYKMYEGIQYVLNPNDPALGFQAENSGGQTGKGVEIEANWEPRKNLKFNGNFAYQNSQDAITHEDPGYSPAKIAALSADWRFTGQLALNARVSYVGERKRPANDPREPLKGYTTMDLTLRSNNAYTGWAFRGGIKNLNNASIYEPSPAPGLIYNDLPMPKRTAFLEVSKEM